jgi:hypothetical protein
MWIKRGINGPEKELFNQSLQAGADFQTINLHYTDLAPLAGDATELGMTLADIRPLQELDLRVPPTWISSAWVKLPSQVQL